MDIPQPIQYQFQNSKDLDKGRIKIYHREKDKNKDMEKPKKERKEGKTALAKKYLTEGKTIEEVIKLTGAAFMTVKVLYYQVKRAAKIAKLEVKPVEEKVEEEIKVVEE